jgi:hypothetical protein
VYNDFGILKASALGMRRAEARRQRPLASSWCLTSAHSLKLAMTLKYVDSSSQKRDHLCNSGTVKGSTITSCR